MDMTPEDYFFWKKLEDDLAVKIPSYLKNGFHMCGFNSALTFKTIDDEDIVHVEVFIRDQLPKLLTTRRENNNKNKILQEADKIAPDTLHNDEKIDFFGTNYALHPNEFKYQRGEMKLIKELAAHVKQIVDCNEGINKGLHHFQMKHSGTKKVKTGWRGTSVSSVGQYFTHNNRSLIHSDNKNPTENSRKLKTKLFEKAKKFLESKYMCKTTQNLSEDFVIVNALDGLNVSGYVVCVFCHSENKQTKVSVYCHSRSDSGSKYWILSNFAKHMKREHESASINVDLKTSLPQHVQNIERNSNKDENTTAQGDAPVNQQIVANTTVTNLKSDSNDDVEISSELSKCTPNLHMQTFIEVEEVELNEFLEQQKKILYSQISTQNLKTIAATLANNEVEIEVAFNLQDDALGHIKVAQINGDGNCLFGALTHQLFNEKINSAEHQISTKKLRADVVNHIKNNFNAFEHELKGRIYEYKDVNNITNIISECNIFLNLCLSRSGCWGGAETIRAVSSLYKVNIIIFNETGPCYIINKFNSSYERTIAVSFRNSSNLDSGAQQLKDKQNNMFRNHYDSVCSIDHKDIYKCTKSLINMLAKTYVTQNQPIVV